MRRIPLVNRKGDVLDYALVDDEDYERVQQHTWGLMRFKKTTVKYAVRWVRVNGKGLNLTMHREILCLPPARTPEVDHIDQNGLNNQRSNIRAVSHTQNQWNRKAYRCNKTGFKGVFASGDRFYARICAHKKPHYLGSFATAIEAHEAYIVAAKKFHGEFAHVG